MTVQNRTFFTYLYLDNTTGMTHLKIVLKGGLGTGIGAELPKGSALKATTAIFSNEVCSNFIAISSRTLLSHHVYGHHTD